MNRKCSQLGKTNRLHFFIHYFSKQDVSLLMYLQDNDTIYTIEHKPFSVNKTKCILIHSYIRGAT